VKLRGRARKITFKDVLHRDLVMVWREEDAMAAAKTGAERRGGPL
jgi:hypothetical protein